MYDHRAPALSLIQCLLFLQFLHLPIRVLAADLILRPVDRLPSVRRSDRLITHLSQNAEATLNELFGF